MLAQPGPKAALVSEVALQYAKKYTGTEKLVADRKPCNELQPRVSISTGRPVKSDSTRTPFSCKDEKQKTYCSTGIRTQVERFRVSRANHYTIPHLMKMTDF